MDAYEWSCWQVLAGVDPFGQHRDDWRTAQLASTIANYAGKFLKDHVPAGDFLMRFEDAEAKTEKMDVATKINIVFSRLMAQQKRSPVVPPRADAGGGVPDHS